MENKQDPTQKRPKNRAVYGFRKDYPGSTGSSDYLIGESRNRRTKEKIRRWIFVALLVLMFCLSFVVTSVCIKLSNRPVSLDEQTEVTSEKASAAEIQGNIKAVYFGEEAFSSADSVNACIAKAKEAGANTVVIEFKNADGDLCYKSSLLTAQDIYATNKAYDSVKENVALIQSNSLKVYAAVSCFEDNKAAAGIAKAGVYKENGELLIADGSSNSWLNPYSEEATGYLKSILAQIKEMGVDGFVLSSVSFPTSDNATEAVYANETEVTNRNASLKSFINSAVFIADGKPVIVTVTYDAAFGSDMKNCGGNMLDSAAKYYAVDMRAFSQTGNILFDKKLFKDTSFASYDFVNSYAKEIKDEQNNGSGFVFVPFADNTTYAKKAIADAGYGSYILE